MPNIKRIGLCDFDKPPLNYTHPWTKLLKGKKVLVVHPFAKSITKQYVEKRALIYPENPDILPIFDLKTVQAVQSVAGNSNGFKNWFEALDYMKNEIDQIDYDIALIGCGAYGFNLAAHIKRMGKKALHTAGFTQLLFDIKGKRWDDELQHLFNSAWIRPSQEETPAGCKKVESATYW